MKSPSSIFNMAIACSAGLVTLLGYFVPALAGIRDVLLQWAVILAGFALLVGIVNLLSAHFQKLGKAKKGGFYSLALIFSFVGSVVVFGLSGPDGTWSLLLFNSVQVPVESALLALLSVVLAYAAIRLFYRGLTRATVLFMLTFLVVLISSAPLFGLSSTPLLSELREWISSVPVTAGARGILIGVALGALAAGLRILMGADRPYGR